MVTECRLSVLVLSEDASSQSYTVVSALVKKMFQMLHPDCKTNKIDFEPASDPEAERRHEEIFGRAGMQGIVRRRSP